MIIRIESPSHPGTEVFFQHSDAMLRAKPHPEDAMFIAEGPKVVLSALDAGFAPVSVLMRERHLESEEGRRILSRCGDAPVYVGPDDVLAALTGFRLERSWVQIAMRRPKERTLASVCEKAHRIAVLENITEPSNLGAVFRSAAALGLDGVLLTPSCCDVYHRRCVRVCMGTVFRLPWARTEADSGISALGEMAFSRVCMALRADSMALDDPFLASREKLAIYLGTEDTGLKDETIAGCDHTVCIPMAPGVDSLNVAAAAAIAFWQLRWRR